jgi:hypothetical protein
MGVSLRQQLLLSSTMLVGALTGYVGRAYAACTGSSGTYNCTGTLTTNADLKRHPPHGHHKPGLEHHHNGG